jgi:hypothetical protein
MKVHRKEHSKQGIRQLVAIIAEPSILIFIISTLFMTVPYLTAGLVLLRKVKPDEIVGEVSL